MRGTRSLAILLLIAPGLVGMLIAGEISRMLWGFRFSPPRLGDLLDHPKALSRFATGLGSSKVYIDRTKLARMLTTPDPEPASGRCTYFETLLKQHQGVESLKDVPVVDDKLIGEYLDVVRSVDDMPFSIDGKWGWGVVAQYSDSRAVVVFQSGELVHDTHGCAAFLVVGDRGALSVRRFVYHYFDVAGLELLSPLVLGLVVSLLLYVLSAFVWAAYAYSTDADRG